MADRAQRISIGFLGGQVIAARVAVDQLEAFQRALEVREGWYALVCEDATMQLDRGQVCFVRIDSDEPRVGFGA
ncbi:MAG: hypothetical protein QOF77_1531 [Solirubrobacteraceae bacterium]|nr:hypothetical protein [Solirubrobacteraceae bacterium]